jgi:2-polyprenyl-3-methyl-5-hydroxy-6-metoxy-1,4-benzoquinol methylase
MTPPRTCPACGAGHCVIYGSYRDEEYFCCGEERFDYWQCRDCGTLQLHPLPLTRLAEIYPTNYYSFQPPAGFSATQAIKNWLDARTFRRVLRGLQGAGLAALDVGGGEGWLLDRLRHLDARIAFTQIVDLDARAGMLATARGHAYACERIETFRSERRFDLVLLLNLIEHVEAPARVLDGIARLLTPQGVVLVKTPNLAAWDARLFRHSYWAGLHVPRHWTVFTAASFRRLLQRSPLREIDFCYTQGAPFWAASTLAALRRRGWVRVDRQRPAVYHPLFAPLAALYAALDFARAPFAPGSQMLFTLRRAPGNALASSLAADDAVLRPERQPPQ